MAFTDSGDDMGPGGPDPGDAGPPGAAGPAPPPAMQGPPPGGPVMAALARRSQQPQPSAPGAGNFAGGLMMVKNAVDMLQQALPSLPAGSQQHKDVLRSLQTLSRHLPQGAPTAGVQQTQLGDMLRNTVRNALMQRIMSQRGGAGTPGGPGPSAPGAPQPPPPSTPLPGA
jgi:hypothetical protein